MAETFLWIELRAFCHPTEQEDRVRRAIETAAPGISAAATHAEGHFGPPLLILTARLESREAMNAFWTRLKGAAGGDRLLESIKDRIDDDCVLHLRLDKQAAFEGELTLVGHDDVIAIRAKVSSFPAKRNEAARRAKAYLAGL